MGRGKHSGGDGCTRRIYLVSLNCTLKMGNLMLCLFYHSDKPIQHFKNHTRTLTEKMFYKKEITTGSNLSLLLNMLLFSLNVTYILVKSDKKKN